MSASRSVTARSKTPRSPEAGKSGQKPGARRASGAENRRIAAMLRDLESEGSAITADIERLRNRFL